MSDTNAVLRDAALIARKTAENTAANFHGDMLCCWDVERVAMQERVIETRQHPEGTGQQIVAIPAFGGAAGHIALWDPPTALAVADLLDALADPCIGGSLPVRQAVETLAKLLTGERRYGKTITASGRD